MQTFNSRSIKKYKGKLILMKYRVNGHTGFRKEHEITGEISASTRYKIIFNVNKSGHEITLEYSQIIDITKPQKK